MSAYRPPAPAGYGAADARTSQHGAAMHPGWGPYYGAAGYPPAGAAPGTGAAAGSGPPFKVTSMSSSDGTAPSSDEVREVPSSVHYSYATGPDPYGTYAAAAYMPYATQPWPSWETMTPEERQYYTWQYYHGGAMYAAAPGTAVPGASEGLATGALAKGPVPAAHTGAVPPPAPGRPPFRTDMVAATGGVPPPFATATSKAPPFAVAPISKSAAATKSAASGEIGEGATTDSKKRKPTGEGVTADSSVTKKKKKKSATVSESKKRRKKKRREERKEEECTELKIKEPSRFESKDTLRFKRRGVRGQSGAPLSLMSGRGGVTPAGAETPVPVASHLSLIHARETAKSKATKAFLLKVLKKECLFQDINLSTLKSIIDVMYVVKCEPGDDIIKQGEYGDAWFVVEIGVFHVVHRDTPTSAPKVVGECKKGSAFGEGSLLFSVPRAATLTAQEPSRVWTLDAKKFIELRATMSKSKAEKSGKMVKFLSKIEFFSSRFGSNDEDLEEIAQALYPKKYRKGDIVMTQGDESKEFFIIRHGTVEVQITDGVTGVSQTVATMKAMESFGERGLLSEIPRAATIVCTSTHVKCYVMKKDDFNNLLKFSCSDAFQEQMREQDAVNLEKEARTQFISLVKCTLLELECIGVLGVGSFGRVSLVQDPTTSETYSLKKVRKNKVIETNQEEHVRNERAVLANLDSDFCCRLYATYKDTLNIYFLLEPVLGGELFTVLRWNQRFSERTARFYTACTVLAFEHLHSKNLIYRDLKPENLLIAGNGYCKLVDFGFAKRRNKSCTLCGTPEYLAPEVIQGYPQNFGVDWWELGIFIYEMVVGSAPFQDDPHMKMYEKILTLKPEFASKLKLSERCIDLIRRLLVKEAHSRLGSGRGGAKQIKSHPWFGSLDWDSMLRQEIKPPYKPKIESATDVSCFEDYEDEDIDEDLLPDPDGSVYRWCDDF